MKETVGFTNDGRVFLQVPIDGPGGQPSKVTLTWSPEDAVETGKHLMEAADRCRAKVGSLIIQPGGA